MPHPRLGPRPLPLHLSTALMTWASSESAWQLWKRDSPSSRPARPRLRRSPSS
jgi:polyhydroxyalkanoate synthase